MPGSSREVRLRPGASPTLAGGCDLPGPAGQPQRVYRWRVRKPSARQIRQQQLLEKIRVAHTENQELYGSPRVHRALGWLYLAAVLDCFSRKIVGWAMDDAMPADLIVDALKMALHQRQLGEDLIHHGDRGVQYASEDYQQVLVRHGITVSMSGRDNCYDNAMMESFWATLKTELIYQRDYATHERARQAA